MRTSIPTPAQRRARALARMLATLALIGCGVDEVPTPEAGGTAPPSDAGVEAAVSPATTSDASSTGASSDASTPPRAAASALVASTPSPSEAGAAPEAGAIADGGANDAGAPSGPCTRESLKAAVESYYSALSARDPSKLTRAPTLKFTENAKALQLGEGLWKTAGAVRFKRSALDVMQCESVTESVVDNGGEDFILGLRLKLSEGAISEVESILVGPDGWFPNPRNIVSSASEDWETPLPDAERAPREWIQKEVVDAYFIGVFGGTIKVADYPFASSCKRAENGFSPGACNFGVPTSMKMMPLHYVIDLEAGIGVGFVLFGSGGRGMLDFHMFKVKSKQVHGVRAVVGPSVSGRGWQ